MRPWNKTGFTILKDRILKGVCHKIFDLYFFRWFERIWASDKQGKVFRIWFRFREIFDHKVRIIRLRGVHDTVPRSKTVRFSKATFILQFFSFMIDVFPKMISPDCPFKSNQRPSKVQILTPQCVHTMDLDSAVWCIPWSLTLWYDAYLHILELDYAVSCTPRSLTPRRDAHRGVLIITT